uniref:Phosphoglycerate mutase n=1 Tax=Glossina morsitans morsitans TaxID=37546 RepID=A0A1B0GE08_GLOMM
QIYFSALDRVFLLSFFLSFSSLSFTQSLNSACLKSTIAYSAAANMNTNKVVLLRHGESEFNKMNLFCGWHDSPLSEKGLDYASKIAVAGLRKHKMEFDLIYTSLLMRAHQTVDVIVKDMNFTNLPVRCHWRLNERHYGNLTGYNKREMADKFGEEQIQIWRRSYDVLPPKIVPENPFYSTIRNNPKFKNIPENIFPETESLKEVIARVLPLWECDIIKEVLKGSRVLVVAHGTVVRALIKHIDDIAEKEITELNIPNSVPCVFEYDLKTCKRVNKMQYLANEEYVKKEQEKVAKIGDYTERKKM